jgi:hypothetical protein
VNDVKYFGLFKFNVFICNSELSVRVEYRGRVLG